MIGWSMDEGLPRTYSIMQFEPLSDIKLARDTVHASSPLQCALNSSEGPPWGAKSPSLTRGPMRVNFVDVCSDVREGFVGD